MDTQLIKNTFPAEQEQYSKRVESLLCEYYGYKPKELRATLEKNGGIDELHFNMLSAKVLQFVADNIKK